MAGEFRAVQFRGMEDVIQAFVNVSPPYWALFNGKTMLEKYDEGDPVAGEQRFKEFLRFLSRSNTTSVYRLQTYDDLPAAGKIKPSTEPDRSFNFTLYDYSEHPTEFRQGTSAALDKIAARLEAMESKLAVLEQEDEPEERLSGIGAKIEKLLEVPAVQSKIGEVISGFIDRIFPQKHIPMESFTQAAAASPGVLNGVPSGGEDAELQKLNAAVGILFQIDPLLGSHLLRLAQVAQKDPGKYNQIISMLNLL